MRLRTSRSTAQRGLLILGLALSGLVAAAPLAATAQESSTIPIAWVAPPGIELNSPCRPGRAETWRTPLSGPETRSENGVAGPFYHVYQGRLVAVEYEVSQADLEAGGSWSGLSFQYWGQALPIDHVWIRFTPPHAGFEEPHYGLVSWLVNPDEEAAITCP